jgi:hypothetical protein
MSKAKARDPKPKPKPKPATLQTKQHREPQRLLRYKPPVDSVRIYDMCEALESGRELTPAMRLEITQALSVLNNFILFHELASTRSHPASDVATHWTVIVAAALVTKYGVGIGTAARAALPSGDEKAAVRVLRAYSNLKKASVWAVDKKQIEEAAARLTAWQIEKGAARLRQKIGKK